MALYEAILLPIYLAIIIVVVYLFRVFYYGEQEIGKYMVPGLLLKLFGVLMFCLIYKFYYGSGDTTVYYNSAAILWQFFETDPKQAFYIINLTPDTYDLKALDFTNQVYFYRSPAAFMVVKLTAVLGIPGLQSYWLISLLFAFLSFAGIWAMFRTWTKIYPELSLYFFIAIFAFPSLFFWGSGILKDTITIGALGWLFYASYHLFIIKKRLFLSLILLLFNGWLIYIVKFYVLVAYFPAVLLWVFFHHYYQIREGGIKFLVSALVVIFAGLFINQFSGQLTGLTDTFTNKLIATAMDFQIYHSNLGNERGQSAYSLGEVEFSFTGILKKFPQSVNVALFRPYFFEAQSPVQMIASIENLFLLLLTFFVIIIVGPFQIIKRIFQNPLILFSLVFALLLAFMVGFTSYNFGALVRYKIPLVPFYTAALVLLWKNSGIPVLDRLFE